MPKSPTESVDSSSDQLRSKESPRPRVPVTAPHERDFDADSLEPSLLERMLKATGARPKGN